MLTSRWIIYFILMLLLLNSFSFGQQEIRKAITAKKNRKVGEVKTKVERGKQHVHNATNQIRAPFDQANARVNQKFQNTRRKIQAIETIIKS